VSVDPRIWRVHGDPLVGATAPGELSGQSVAVKDLFAVEGHAVGAGNPAWLAQAPREPRHAEAVRRLLANGAAVQGIAQTDEFAYSLAGTNLHHGTPPNPRAPGRISGGSSSGSASAVSTGQASIGLGTDTGGSIRVPSAYQGLWGIRTTHGAVSTDGVLPLAPAFDTVGWMTRSPDLLAAVARVLVPDDTAAPGEVVQSPTLTALAEPAVARAVTAPAATEIDWPMARMSRWLGAMQTFQAWQAWQTHGSWLAHRMDTLGPDVRSRFERAASLSADVGAAAEEEVVDARDVIRGLLGDRVLLVPSTSSVAPPLGDAAALDAARQATMQLTCLAGIAGLPAVSVPVATHDGSPAGACLIGPAGSDRALIDLAMAWNDSAQI
jgi:amidase